MSRVIAIVAVGFTLAACTSSSWTSFELPKPAPSSASLRLESEPPGAEARVANGPSCRTPCEVSVAVGGDTSVTFNLQGYAPQTIAVQALPPGNPRFGEPEESRLTPNPVFAELEPAPPPRRPPPKKAPAKKKAAPKAAPVSSAQPAPAQAPSPFPPPPATAFPPPPASSFPPPQR